jgi:hypothetical protein
MKQNFFSLKKAGRDLFDYYYEIKQFFYILPHHSKQIHNHFYYLQLEFDKSINIFQFF